MDDVFDVAIIGGGINGAGCASDAALRGLSVFLCENDDLASQTSSNSTKLIHGGLRYLEHLDFSLVRKALNERQTLIDLAPHLVRPLAFVLPHQSSMRPLWILRAGLFLYDHLSQNNQLPPSRLIRRSTEPPYFSPLLETYQKGFLFYDAETDDARLTIANALQAKEHGATIMPRTALIKAHGRSSGWELTLKPKEAPSFQIRAKTLINATGPWVPQINQLLGIPSPYQLSLVKGSHLVVPQQYEGDHAYLLQHQDKRIVFAIPFHGCTMIGTTEIKISSDNLHHIHMDEEEIQYLCALTGQYFKTPCDPLTILHTFSGVRPLLSVKGKSPTALSRDYTYHFTQTPAPAITIYGGKLTTYRQLAEEAINRLKTIFPQLAPSTTAETPLPGATLGHMSFGEYKQYARQKYHWLDETIKNRYLSSYGTRTDMILAGCENMADLGPMIHPALYQKEIDYLKAHEWAESDEDILWRRTKLGLTIGT